jgi:hypothetical protein
MYTQSEILKMARECKTIAEVMETCKYIRLLICAGLMQAEWYHSYIFIKRFRELI